jgi:hypothetical protein
MSFTDYAELKMLDHAFGKTAWISPTIWVGLFTVVATDVAGSGTEVTGGAYARVATTAASWAAASAGQISNAVALTFPVATADWGTVVGWATFDAATAGNRIVHAALTTSKPILNGDTASFAIGGLSHTLD